MNKWTSSLAAVAVCAGFAGAAQATIIYSENFDDVAFPDQALQVAIDGNASVSFGANATIGDTNAAGDGTPAASSGATSGLSTRNGTRGYITGADANFTSGSGNVGQLHSHTAGGFAVLSTGPIGTVNGVNNQPTPIAITPVAGDIYRVSFDMYKQADRLLTSSLGVNWNLKDAAFTVFAFPDTWDDFSTAAVGDTVAVVKDLVITQAMVDAGVTSFGPQFTFFNNPNGADMAVNTAYAQIDNFQIELIPVPEPGSLVLLGLGGLALVARRRA
ncbi:PEP-CTERM sorting domain-containing protein [Algisphaera agarilytica]|uniref:Ice-binding protein C-terminal domain-containing protein n=1 Tax=Algisphaera agarilytica TaxID=1385975 RepID=A0A7X0H3P5_9BACT|nr:PEP-CTERM sorting domain-containing protein [Algisphaera agarilytica]MBB6428712.1 hypothetical protein [Algisphaera agarilytica]